MTPGKAGTGLALLGGDPVRTEPWPSWPETDERTERRLRGVLSAGRWSVTNPTPRGPTLESEFAGRFADLYRTAHCVPVASGSAALRLALLGLGVRPLDRVAVPGLTWAAVASAVAGAGAVPVPVDVAADSLCMSVPALERVLATAPVRPVAVVVVHQNCAVADIEGLVAVARRYGLSVVEDCSQAHGASVRGRPVGGFADAGIFSFQQNKMLTCGEGGAVITPDDGVRARLEQFRSVGRRATVGEDGAVDLSDAGEVVGDSVVLSEFHAAVLLDQLDRFPAQHRRRLANVARLEELLAESPLLTPVTASPPGSERGYHKYVWRLDRELLGGLRAADFARALAAELGREVGVVDPGFTANRLLNPRALATRVLPRAVGFSEEDFAPPQPLPVASAARDECFHIRHDAFLGGESELADIAATIDKVWRHRHDLVAWARRDRREVAL